MEVQKRVLIVKGKAGLGNRFLSVLGSILYCELHDRILCIDWSDGAYAPKGEDAFQLGFRCDFPMVQLSDLVAQSDVTPSLWQNNLSRSVTEMIDEFHPDFWDNETAVFSKYSIRFRSDCPPNKVVVRWSYHDDIGEFFHWLGMKVFTEKGRFEALRSAAQTHMNFESTLLEQLEAVSAQLLSGKTIGIHLRFTDNKTPLHVLLSRLGRLSRAHKDAKIFLATDNSMIEEKLRSLYPGRIVSTDKPLPSNGAPFHRQCQGDEARRSALLDMYLLSRCDYLIYSSRSTFGYCAALLSNQPKDKLFNCLTLWQHFKLALVSLKWNALRFFVLGLNSKTRNEEVHTFFGHGVEQSPSRLRGQQ